MGKKENPSTKEIKITAIVCLTLYGTILALMNIDGSIALSFGAVIGGIAGYELRAFKKRR
ncbi:MAG: hypothetical protein KIH08_12770 [Candidatus Freyarchaeota archaeon]|nr:hypothetical protein [Candidatus Jordarchaeia archaeon]